MDATNGSGRDAESTVSKELPDRTGRLSRRAVLRTATVAAGAVAGASASPAETPPAVGYGVPMVELFVPAGALTLEQKAEMIKGVTEVVVGAAKLSPEQARRLWVEIFETAEGGWGVGGQVFVPRKR